MGGMRREIKNADGVESSAWWMYRFTDALYRADKPSDIHEAALEVIIGSIGCDRASILLREDYDDKMHFVAWRHISEGFRRAADGHSPWEKNQTKASPIYVDDVSRWSASDKLKSILLTEGIRAVGFIPLITGGCVIGKFGVYFDAPHTFIDAEKDLTLVIARQLGFSIKTMTAEKERVRAEERLRYLAAMVEASDDAIVTKDLDGFITSWNAGAERLFGFTSAEAVGKHITIIIPEERLEEERQILARLRAGKRVEHFETIRRRRDGSLVDISLTVSPVKDLFGNIIGASKIARDISERRKAAAQQDLLLREMHHRVLNLFTLASAIVNLSARKAQSVEQLAKISSRRLQALAAAQSLTMRPLETGQSRTTLHALLQIVLKPFRNSQDEDDRSISIYGDDPDLTNKAATPLALALHEFATNALKYGGLSENGHGVVILCKVEDETVRIIWKEAGVTRSFGAYEGFGSRLIKATVEDQLGGRVFEVADGAGLAITIETTVAKLQEY